MSVVLNDIILEYLFQEEFLRERSKHYGGDVVWLRPKDIVRPDIPILVSNKNEGFEIRQGKIFFK